MSVNSAVSSLPATSPVVAASGNLPGSQTVQHRSRRALLLESMQGYLGTGLQLQAMSEAVVPVPEAELELDQPLAE